MHARRRGGLPTKSPLVAMEANRRGVEAAEIGFPDDSRAARHPPLARPWAVATAAQPLCDASGAGRGAAWRGRAGQGGAQQTLRQGSASPERSAS